MQRHDVRGACCHAVAVRSINEIWVKARVCLGIGWVVWLFCVHWVWRDVLIGFLARLIEGVWGSPSPVPSPLDSCLRRNDGGYVGHTPRASLRSLAPLSLGRKGQIRLFRNHRRVGWDRLR